MASELLRMGAPSPEMCARVGVILFFTCRPDKARRSPRIYLFCSPVRSKLMLAQPFCMYYASQSDGTAVPSASSRGLLAAMTM